MSKIEINIGNYKKQLPFEEVLEDDYRIGGYVYFVTDGSFVKIGKTKSSLQQRIDALQTGNPNKLVVLQALRVRNPDFCELHIHELFNEHRIGGEWFDLLPTFDIVKRENGYNELLQSEIEKLKKENHILKCENNRWRYAKYSHGSKYCSECGHPLTAWWTEKRTDDN